MVSYVRFLYYQGMKEYNKPVEISHIFMNAFKCQVKPRQNINMILFKFLIQVFQALEFNINHVERKYTTDNNICIG